MDSSKYVVLTAELYHRQRVEALKLSADDISHLADALRVPADQRAEFSEIIKSTLYYALYEHAHDLRDPRTGQNENAKQLAKLARAKTDEKVRAAYDILGPGARSRLAVMSWRAERFGPRNPDPSQHALQIGDIHEMEMPYAHQHLERLSHDTDALREAARDCIRETGAPSKSRNIPGNPLRAALDYLVTEIARQGRARGWVITLSKDNRTGTLLDFLNIARPLLPSKLIPENLSLRRLDAILREKNFPQRRQRKRT